MKDLTHQQVLPHTFVHRPVPAHLPKYVLLEKQTTPAVLVYIISSPIPHSVDVFSHSVAPKVRPSFFFFPSVTCVRVFNDTETSDNGVDVDFPHN